MSPLLSTFQPLPMLPVPLLTPGGATPFVLTDVLAGDVQPVTTAMTRAMTVAGSGPRVAFDCTMPAPVSDEPVTEPASAPPSPIPAAALLASLDRSARALLTRPPVAPPSRSAKTVSTDGNDEAPATPDKSDAQNASVPAVVGRESASPVLEAVVIAPLVQPSVAMTPSIGHATPAPTSIDERSTPKTPIIASVLPNTERPVPVKVDAFVSIPLPGVVLRSPTKAAPVAHLTPTRDVLPIAVAQAGRVDGPPLPGPIMLREPAGKSIGLVSKPSYALPRFIADNPVARWLPTQDSLPGAVPFALAQAMQVDSPTLPAPMVPFESAESGVGVVSRPAGALPEFVANTPVAHRMPMQVSLPDAVPVAFAWAIQVDGPAVPGMGAPNTPVAIGAESVVPPIFIAQPQTAQSRTAPARITVTVENVATEGLDNMQPDTATPALTAAIMPTGVPQPGASPASVVELLASSLTSPEVATIDRQLDLARGDAWLDTLARDIAASADGNSRLRFGLSPERLGKLDVEVSRGDAGVSVTMTTRSEEARVIIAAAQPRLVEELRAQGTRVAGAEVSAQTQGHTGGQAGGAPRSPVASIIDAAVEARASVATDTTTAPATGRYA